MEFQQDDYFESLEFYIMGWEYYKWNNATLRLECQ